MRARRDPQILRVAEEAEEASGREQSGSREIQPTPTGIRRRDLREETAPVEPPRTAVRDARSPLTGPGSAVLEALESGNRNAALRALVARYGDGLHKFCLRFLRDRSAAEDVVQDVFLAAGENLSELREHEAIGGWLYQAAKFKCIAQLRRVTKGEMVPFNEDDWYDKSPAADDALALRSILATCLDALDPLNRSFVVQHHHEDVPVAALVRQSGLGMSAVKMKLFRTIDALRKCLRSKGVDR